MKVGLAILCPITHQIKGYPFEVLIPDGLAVSGAILADQVKSLDWRARRADLICTLPVATVAEALRKLGTLLDYQRMENDASSDTIFGGLYGLR
jgi:mRNA interferase MazF